MVIVLCDLTLYGPVLCFVITPHQVYFWCQHMGMLLSPEGAGDLASALPSFRVVHPLLHRDVHIPLGSKVGDVS